MRIPLTPTASDARGAGSTRGDGPKLTTATVELPDPTGTGWGPYGPAVDRWTNTIGRAAPTPTQPGRHGRPVLAPAFVEWLMGLPAGWVTDPRLGLARTAALRVLGNGVVPQQAAAALRILLCEHRWQLPT